METQRRKETDGSPGHDGGDHGQRVMLGNGGGGQPVVAGCDAFEFSCSNQTAKVLCMDTFRDNVLARH
jgi:hypothetical protein